jgi:hypothetical protein
VIKHSCRLDQGTAEHTLDLHAITLYVKYSGLTPILLTGSSNDHLAFSLKIPACGLAVTIHELAPLTNLSCPATSGLKEKECSKANTNETY